MNRRTTPNSSSSSSSSSSDACPQYESLKARMDTLFEPKVAVASTLRAQCSRRLPTSYPVRVGARASLVANSHAGAAARAVLEPSVTLADWLRATAVLQAGASPRARATVTARLSGLDVLPGFAAQTTVVLPLRGELLSAQTTYSDHCLAIRSAARLYERTGEAGVRAFQLGTSAVVRASVFGGAATVAVGANSAVSADVARPAAAALDALELRVAACRGSWVADGVLDAKGLWDGSGVAGSVSFRRRVVCGDAVPDLVLGGRLALGKARGVVAAATAQAALAGGAVVKATANSTGVVVLSAAQQLSQWARAVFALRLNAAPSSSSSSDSSNSKESKRAVFTFELELTNNDDK